MHIGHSSILLLASSLLISTASASAIINGSFESGDFSGWTLTGYDLDGDTGGPGATVDSANAYSGYSAAHFTCTYDGTVCFDTLSQTFATTVGQTYTLDFWMAFESVDPYGNFSVSVDDFVSTLASGSPNFGYTEYSPTFTATGDSTTLSFKVAAAWFEDAFLDDVSVTTPTPEPGTLTMMTAALAGWAALRRNRITKPKP